jgi:hypothetical protein
MDFGRGGRLGGGLGDLDLGIKARYCRARIIPHLSRSGDSKYSVCGICMLSGYLVVLSVTAISQSASIQLILRIASQSTIPSSPVPISQLLKIYI